MSGGLAPAATADGNISQLQFLASMCALGANHLVDAIGYHPYSYPVTPQNPVQWNAWAQIATTSPSFRTILAQYGTPNKPIWATEYGAPTGGPGAEATAQGMGPVHPPLPCGRGIPGDPRHRLRRSGAGTPGVRALFCYTNKDSGPTRHHRELLRPATGGRHAEAGFLRPAERDHTVGGREPDAMTGGAPASVMRPNATRPFFEPLNLIDVGETLCGAGSCSWPHGPTVPARIPELAARVGPRSLAPTSSAARSSTSIDTGKRSRDREILPGHG